MDVLLNYTRNEINAFLAIVDQRILSALGIDASSTDSQIASAKSIYDLVLEKTTGDLLVDNVKSANGDVILEFEGEGDDKGLHLKNGQLAVGEWDNGKETVLGEGDSTTDTMVVLQTNDDITYTDVTSIFSSDTGSVQGLFNGTTTGKTIYVGGDFKFYGLKAKINTDGLVEPMNVILEYWNGSGWEQSLLMASDSQPPLNQFGWDIAQNNSTSEQWRFGLDPYGIKPLWEKSTIEGVEKYWGRFRITATITTDPIIEQLKLHTNRMQIKENGLSEFLGTARYKDTIMSGTNNLINNSAETPRDTNIKYAPGVTARIRDNRFEANNDQSTLLTLNIKEGLDTSILVALDISYDVLAAVTGDIDLELNKILVEDGFVYDGNGVMVLCDNPITTVVSAIAEQRMTTRFYIRLDDALPNSAYRLQLKRNGSSAADTLASSIAISHLEVSGYFWKP